uniref:eIF5Ba n=1 Tax=Arundo donax TaxID=35708 RepID=A0A0A9H3S8_ARUDO
MLQAIPNCFFSLRISCQFSSLISSRKYSLSTSMDLLEIWLSSTLLALK